jgi:hypothetical protein
LRSCFSLIITTRYSGFGIFLDTTLSHYRGKQFVPGKPQGDHEDIIAATSTALDRTRDLSPILTPDLIDRNEARCFANRNVKEDKMKAEVVAPERRIGAAEKDKKVGLSDQRRLGPKHSAPKAPTPAQSLPKFGSTWEN